MASTLMRCMAIMLERFYVETKLLGDTGGEELEKPILDDLGENWKKEYRLEDLDTTPDEAG